MLLSLYLAVLDDQSKEEQFIDAHTTITIRPGVNVSLTYKKAEGIITFEPRVTQSVMAKGDHTFRYNAQGDIVA